MPTWNVPGIFVQRPTHSTIILLLPFYNNDLYDTLKSTFCVICVSWRKDGFIFILWKKCGKWHDRCITTHCLKGKNGECKGQRKQNKCHQNIIVKRFQLKKSLRALKLSYIQTFKGVIQITRSLLTLSIQHNNLEWYKHWSNEVD